MVDPFFLTLGGLSLILLVLGGSILANSGHLKAGKHAELIYFERCRITIGEGGLFRLGGNLVSGQIGLTDDNIVVKMFGKFVFSYSDVKNLSVERGILRNFVRLRLEGISAEVRIFSRDPDKLVATINSRLV